MAIFKKTLLILTFTSLFSTPLYSQTKKKEVEKITTKIDLFTSKTGVIIKITDTKLPKIGNLFEGAETRIRKLSNGETTAYYYQILFTNIASIEYSDLLEILKALDVLETDFEKDLISKPDYLEHKFKTVDGFEIGYILTINGTKAEWYIQPGYSSDYISFLEIKKIRNVLLIAKNKIEELKK